MAAWHLSKDTGPVPQGARDEQDALVRALTLLNERDETVVTLRYLEDQSYEEVGQIMGMRPETARAAVSRAVRKLRRLLTPLRPKIESNE